MVQQTSEQIREHYEIEKELADRIKNVDAVQRRQLYTTVYDELLRRVPHHPHLIQQKSKDIRNQAVSHHLKLLKNFINKDVSFLEIGAGDCALSLRVAEYVKQVFAVDVCHDIVSGVVQLPNFQLLISDGTSIPVPENSIHVAYSNQLMEHLHPDDAMQQLTNIYNALTHDGIYVCITPNRYTGPHDISKHFDDISTCLHLKEYTIKELSDLFREAGFPKLKLFAGGKGLYIPFPLKVALLFEKSFNLLPLKFRKVAAKFMLFQTILGIKMIGFKRSIST
jgi:SAM-dependent methyltransferase